MKKLFNDAEALTVIWLILPNKAFVDLYAFADNKENAVEAFQAWTARII